MVPMSKNDLTNSLLRRRRCVNNDRRAAEYFRAWLIAWPPHIAGHIIGRSFGVVEIKAI
jgi:hypothetical protein